MIRILLFSILAGADLVLTHRLLSHSSGSFYESNPLANWILQQTGWMGLTLFKILIVALIIGLIVIITRFRPQTGGKVLSLACLIQFVVVAYSVTLMTGNKDANKEPVVVMSEGEMDGIMQFRQTMQQLRSKFIANKCNLNHAVTELSSHSRMKDPAFQQWLLDNYPASSVQGSLNLWFVDYVTFACPSREVMNRLTMEQQQYTMLTLH